MIGISRCERILISCAVCLLALPPWAQHRETVSGQAVAYSPIPACLNGNVHWTLIIRVHHPKNGHSRFINLDFSLPWGKLSGVDNGEAHNSEISFDPATGLRRNFLEFG